VRIAEIEPIEPLGHDDRRFPVWREVEVVGVGHHNLRAGFRGLRIDRGQATVETALAVVGDPQRFEVPGRNDVLWLEPDFEAVDDLHLLRIDDIDLVRTQIRHIDAV
jgi:hypothetical protein